MPRPCRGRDAARPYKGGGLPSAWRQSRSTRTPLPRRCANGMPRPCRGRDAARLCKDGDSPSARRRSRSARTPLLAGFLAPCCPRGKPAALGRSCAGGAPRFRRFCFTCGSGAYFRICKPRGCSRGSAFPAEAAVTAQRDGQRVAVLRLSLRKRRLLRNATDSGSRFFVRFPCGSGGYCATRRSGSRFFVRFPCGSGGHCAARWIEARFFVRFLRKRRLLCSATDSGSRLFVRPPCGSGVCCAARRTAGRGSSSAFSAEVAHCATRASSAATSASLARMA